MIDALETLEHIEASMAAAAKLERHGCYADASDKYQEAAEYVRQQRQQIVDPPMRSSLDRVAMALMLLAGLARMKAKAT